MCTLSPEALPSRRGRWASCDRGRPALEPEDRAPRPVAARFADPGSTWRLGDARGRGSGAGIWGGHVPGRTSPAASERRPPKERGRGSLCVDFPPSRPLPANFARGRVGSLFSRRDRGLRGVSPWPLLPCACGRRPSRPRGPGVEGRIGLLCAAVRGPRPCPATASFLWFRLRAVGCGPGGLNGQRQKQTLRKFYVAPSGPVLPGTRLVLLTAVCALYPLPTQQSLSSCSGIR